MLLALFLLMWATPLGYLPITPLGVTLLTIPVALAAMLYGLPAGLFLGAAFGLSSLYRAFSQPTPFNVPFMDPIVSVFPRLLIPIVVWALAKLLRFDPRQPVLGKSLILGASAALCNTVAVLGMLGLRYGSIAIEIAKNAGFAAAGRSFWGMLSLYGAASGIPEAVVCSIISASILAAYAKTLRKKTRKDS